MLVMGTNAMEDLLRICPIDWAEDAEQEFGNPNPKAQVNIHAITWEIAQAVAEIDTETLMSQFTLKRIPMFEPSLPIIGEEDCSPALQIDYFKHPILPCRRLGRKASTSNLRESATREVAKPQRPVTATPMKMASPTSRIAASDYELSKKYFEFPSLPRQRKRDKWKSVLKKAWDAFKVLQVEYMNYPTPGGWIII